MENLVYYKYKNTKGKPIPTKMSGMMNGQMWLAISSLELKKKTSVLSIQLYFQSFLEEKSHESDFKNKKNGAGKRDVTKG